MGFEKLYSQERVKNILQGIIVNGRVSGAYLFIGPEQCGKTTAAREFIKTLNCRSAAKPCQTCSSCQRITNNNSVNFYQIFPENSIKIETIRELKQFVQYGPREDRYLLVLLQQAEKLTSDAANSFLKLLEEPPPNVFFILETSRPDALPRTIHSRCQKLVFDQLDSAALSNILRQQNPENKTGLEEALALSGGLLKNAGLILQEKEKIDLLIRTIGDIKNKSMLEISNLADILSKNKEDTLKCLNIIMQYFRNILALPQAKLLREYLKTMQKNVNLRLTLEVMLLKLKEVV